MQRNSPGAVLGGGPVVLRPVRDLIKYASSMFSHRNSYAKRFSDVSVLGM